MSTTTATNSTVASIWLRFQEVGFTPNFGPGGSRALIAIYRRLAATGEAIPMKDALAIADAAGFKRDAAQEMFENSTERDDEANIRGIIGLSLNESAHSFIVGEQRLSTWCALDPLFIAPTIEQDVAIESSDPRSGEPVNVTVSAGAVESYSPQEAVVSIVVPESGSASESVEAVWMMFCDHVHFFANQASAEEHFAGRDMEVYFLPIREAFELGGVVFKTLHDAI